jgi:cell division protein FtsW
MAEPKFVTITSYIIFFCWTLLIAIGLSAIFSVTYFTEGNENSINLVLKQFLSGSAGFLLGLFLAKTKFKELVFKQLPLAFIIIAFLVLPLFIGDERFGARRWVNLGFFSLQPAELVKVLWIFFLSEFFKLVPSNYINLRYMVFLGFVACITFLLFLQKDLGSIAFIVIMLFVTLLVAKVSVKIISFASVLALLILGVGISFENYRLSRLKNFLDPFSDPKGAGFQVIQSLIAINEGGWWGKGIGESTQKKFYLPAAHTDFIFSVIVEEAGLVTGIFIILLFITLLFCFLYRAYFFSRIRKVGLLNFLTGFFLFSSAAYNIGVCLGLFPIKGLVLPFVSYGGSAVFAYSFLVSFVSSYQR